MITKWNKKKDPRFPFGENDSDVIKRIKLFKKKMIFNNCIHGKRTATLLIAPHHGRKTSPTASFIDAMSPEYLVFSAGYRNRFGFSKQDIIPRYELHQVKIFNTELA